VFYIKKLTDLRGGGMNIPAEFFATFFGAALAFISNWLVGKYKEKKNRKYHLIKTRYILEKYLKNLKAIKLWYIQNKIMLPGEQLEHVPNNLDRERKRKLASLRYKIFVTLDMPLQIDPNEISFLADGNIKNEKTLDKIILAASQHKKVIAGIIRPQSDSLVA